MLNKIYLITIFLSSLTGLYHFKKLPLYLKGLSLFLVLTTIIECIGYFFKNNTWMFNIFTEVEFVFYFLLYRYVLKNSKQKKLIFFFLISSLIASVSNMLFFQGLNKFNNYSYSYSCILLCITVILYYQQLLHHDNPQPLIRVSMFWVSTGLLAFYACNFFFMGLLNYILSVSLDLAKQLFMIITALNIIMYSLFTVGIICSTTPQRSRLS